MDRTWVLVANSAEARLLRRGGQRDPLEATVHFDNPPGRAHEGDLVTDRGAAVLQSGARGQRRYTQPEVSAREHAVEAFVTTLARTLVKGRATGRFAQLVLVAPPDVLGKLRTALDEPTRALITLELDKNLTRLPVEDLDRTLKDRALP